MLLFIGDDWAEDHHNVEIEDETGRRLAKSRLPEGLDGIPRLHTLVAEHAPAEWAELPSEELAGRVFVGIETDRDPWVTALRAAGYRVFAINSFVSGAVPGTALNLRGEERRGRCPRSSRDRSARS